MPRLLEGEKMPVLCREFDISRKTGYKIFSRYQDCGLEALTDRSRRPYRQAIAHQGGRWISLWSKSLDRELTDIFAVQDEIAVAVLAALKPNVCRYRARVGASSRSARRKCAILNTWRRLSSNSAFSSWLMRVRQLSRMLRELALRTARMKGKPNFVS